MLFNSYIFIFTFLPLAVIGYYVLHFFEWKKAAKIWLIGMSLWFYGYNNPMYLLVIGGSVVFNYLISKLFYCEKIKRAGRRAILAGGIFVNLLSIFFFKYYDFFIENVNAVLKKEYTLLHLVLPLGISFFTFQQISYLVDSYRKETENYGFVEYALFVTFFPQLVAGPIVLHDEIIPQFNKKEKVRFDFDLVSKGISFFVVGLFKKVLIADTFGVVVATGWEQLYSLTSLEALIVSLAYTFQIYFDFSGYCDMASGIAFMFGIQLPMNFDSPYKATSIIEFWKRWHMTLSRFLRKYIYFPLGGSRKGAVITYVNVMIVFLASGIWHGAGWTFLVWGLMHGLFYCFTKMFAKFWNRMHLVWQWLITFVFVDFTWVIFRAPTIGDAVILIRKILSMNDFNLKSVDLITAFWLPEFTWLENKIAVVGRVTNMIPAFWLWIWTIGALFIVLNFENKQRKKFVPSALNAMGTAVLLLWSVVSLTGMSTFLYFNF